MALPLLLFLGMIPQSAETPIPPATDSFAEIPLLQAVPGTFTPWMQHLKPTAQETAFATIPWRPTFAQGVLDADLARLPLLLWVMNGHPLGCT